MSLDPSPSNYALVGAVSFLCGITRMNLSLVVLMMEISAQASGASNSSAFGVPFLLALGVAKGVSSAIFGYSLYDGLIVCKGYPYLFNTHEVSSSSPRASPATCTHRGIGTTRTGSRPRDGSYDPVEMRHFIGHFISCIHHHRVESVTHVLMYDTYP